MSAVIDFHSHILPGMDDGSRSVEESIAMLRMEAEQGITHVVATPHFYARQDSPERFLERRKTAEKQLREEMEKYPGLPRLTMGAEVYYFPGISESEALFQLTIGGKSSILLEMAHSPWTDRMYEEIEDIYVKQGITPVIAHVDRYIAPFRTYGIPDRLSRMPVLVQANGSFFLERRTRNMALRMLKGGQIHLLGSDCHSLRSRRPNLGETLEIIEKRLGSQALERIRRHEVEIL